VTQLVAHATWRPDWGAGRPRYWWYLTFAGQTHLAEVAARLQDRLRDVDAAEPIPRRWLHLTVQDIGFADECGEDLPRLVECATERLHGMSPLALRLGPVITLGSAVVLAAEPVEDLTALRSRLQDAMSSAGTTAAVPGPAVFHPHVSLTYLKRECDAAEVLRPVENESTTSLHVSVTSVTLAKVTRGDCSYRWDTCAEIPLGRG
jgi:2'-5' RNA ligase